MREFVPTHRGPPPSTSLSFRNNSNQEKDESLAAIMARRRRMADATATTTTEKSVEGGGTNEESSIISSKSAFSPRSNRMKRRESMGSTGGMTNGSDHTPTNQSVETPPPPPPPGTLNELQMAMFKRRSQVDDTTLPIVSPRQKRRVDAANHIPMSPIPLLHHHGSNTGGDGTTPSPSSPQTSVAARAAASLQQRLAANKMDLPKVALSVLPSPIPKNSPKRHHNKTDEDDDRSKFNATTPNRSGSDNTTTQRSPTRLPSSPFRYGTNDAGEDDEEEIGDDDYEGVDEADGDGTESSILYADTSSENDDVFQRSDDDDDNATGIYASSDDGINLGALSSGDEYYFAASDDSRGKPTPQPRFNNHGSRSQQPSIAQQRRPRRPARRPRRKPAATNGQTNPPMMNNDDDPDESGPTYYDGSNSYENYPIASDTEESECDPLRSTSFDRADKFAKSDSFCNESNNQNMNIDSSGNGDDDDDDHHNDNSRDDAMNAPDAAADTDDVEDGSCDEDMSNDGRGFAVAADSDDEMIVMYASTSTGGPMYDEQTVDESIFINERETAIRDALAVGDNNDDNADDLAQFVKERSSNEFNDFGSYADEEAINRSVADVGQQDSGHTSLFSYSNTSVGTTSSRPVSLSGKHNTNQDDMSMVGGKIVDGRVDRDIPLGGEEENNGDGDDSNSTTSGQKSRSSERSKSKAALPYVRVCSRPTVIALILVGSVVIGVCIGLFTFGRSDTKKTISAPPIMNTTEPEVYDPNRSKVLPEHLPTYDIICPLLVDCSTLTDAETSSGKAFDWLVTNQTANPELTSMLDGTKIQRYALATLYFSTGGDAWLDTTNWLTNIDTCDWFSSADSGSGCGIEGQTSFISLHMDTNNVKGELPYELSLLTDLKEISIRNPAGTDQYLKGTLPASIGKLTSLTTLEVSGNQFSSGIPTEFGLCTSLTILDLSYNGLNGEVTTSISALSNLTTLNLQGNFFAGNIDPTVFEGTTSLVDINLEGNQFTGLPDTIMALKKIETMLLGSNRMSTVPLAITQLSTLAILDLSDNRILQSIPPQLGRMTTLKRLDLSRNQLTGIIPVEIGNLVNLDLMLDLSFNTLTGILPSRIGQLVQLRRLRLDGNRLSGTIPAALALLNKIEEIRLDDNNFIGTVPVDVCKLYDTLRPASFADCEELQNTTCITNCCTSASGCVCQFEKTDPLLCIKDLQ